MATKLNKPITRETDSSVFDSGKLKDIIVSIEPTRGGALIGFRLKGTRDTFRLPVGSLFVRAVDHHNQKVEQKAKRLHKEDKVPIRSARSRARKELAKELRNGD
jgi:hypothetical protein